MTKGGGMGTKRDGSRAGKGMGKCEPNSRAEQCGNGRGLDKGKFEGMTQETGLNPFSPNIPVNKPILSQTKDLILLKKQAKELEGELKKIKDKILKLS